MQISNLEKYIERIKITHPWTTREFYYNYWGNSYILPIFWLVYFRTNLHQQKLGILQMTDACENEISPLNLL